MPVIHDGSTGLACASGARLTSAGMTSSAHIVALRRCRVEAIYGEGELVDAIATNSNPRRSLSELPNPESQPALQVSVSCRKSAQTSSSRHVNVCNREIVERDRQDDPEGAAICSQNVMTTFDAKRGNIGEYEEFSGHLRRVTEDFKPTKGHSSQFCP